MTVYDDIRRQHYPIPARAANAWRQHLEREPQNPGLVFDRYTPQWGDTDKEAKKVGLQSVVLSATRADAALLRAWNERWEAMTNDEHLQAKRFTLRTDWRFVTGLGRKGPLEVGFTFNRYGFPILPGSGLKGVASSFAELGEKRTQADADFRAIFGRAPEEGGQADDAQSGQAVFFDGIPAELPVLELDIMNPHYPDYYQDESGRTPPTNWQSPIPVYFLTVGAGTLFRFAVGWRGAREAGWEALHEQARHWLIEGLTQLGAGAKTSAGYGFFLNEEESKKPGPGSRATPQPVTHTAPTSPQPVRPPQPRHFSEPAALPKPEVGSVVRGQVIRVTDNGDVYLKFTGLTVGAGMIPKTAAGNLKNYQPNQARICVVLNITDEDGLVCRLATPEEKKGKVLN